MKSVGDAVQSKAKDLVLLAGDLGKNEPKKGDAESWKKLTKSYENERQEVVGCCGEERRCTRFQGVDRTFRLVRGLPQGT